jgi:hypothetical protein
MVPEAELRETEAGLVPASAGWFVLNARDARWFDKPEQGHSVRLTGYDEYEAETFFPILGMAIRVVGPREPTGTYHWETEQERFLVLAGEGLLIVEGQERVLKQARGRLVDVFRGSWNEANQSNAPKTPANKQPASAANPFTTHESGHDFQKCLCAVISSRRPDSNRGPLHYPPARASHLRPLSEVRFRGLERTGGDWRRQPGGRLVDGCCVVLVENECSTRERRSASTDRVRSSELLTRPRSAVLPPSRGDGDSVHSRTLCRDGPREDDIVPRPGLQVKHLTLLHHGDHSPRD